MALLKGLASINKHIEAEDAKFSGSSEDRVQTKWFKIDDKQSVKVVFLQEFDEDSENYSAKNGVGFVAVEHSNPKNFKRKAVCTFDDEGACWACEQHQKDWKAGWRGRSRMYINVLVDDNKGEPYVAVLSQGLSGKMITPTLFEYAGEDGKISHAWFTIKRNGSGLSDTSYSIRQGKEHGLDVESYDLFDLEKVVRQVPYAEQEAHYRSGEEETPAEDAPAAPAVSAGSTSVDSEW